MNADTMQTNRPATERRRGIVLILVLVVLLMIVVLGLMYMQAARLDSLAVEGMNTRYGNQAMQMAVQHVRSLLRSDVTGGEEGFVNGAPATLTEKRSNYEGFAAANEGYSLLLPASDEPFDYPHTHPDYPGEEDDRWLASLVPNLVMLPSNSDLTWQHTSDMRWDWPRYSGDYYRQNPNFVVGVGQVPDPDDIDATDFPAIAAAATAMDNGTLSHEELEIMNPDGVAGDDWDIGDPDADGDGRLDFEVYAADADGDGIPDSRWQYMPIRQINNTRYVWAVRIVDLSGKANVNMWSALRNNAGALVEAERPRWDHPAEMDLSLLFSDSAFIGSPAAQPELQSLLDHRLGTNALPTPRATRLAFWEDFARRMGDPVGNAYTGLGLDSEIDLLYRNGLNHDRVTSDLETALASSGSTWLRSNQSGERAWSAADPTNWTSLTDYFRNNPRLYLTTMGGASVYHGAPRTPYPNTQSGNSSGDITKGNVEHLGKEYKYIEKEDVRYVKRSLDGYPDAKELSWQIRRPFDRGRWLIGPWSASDWDAEITEYPYAWVYNSLHPSSRDDDDMRHWKRRQLLTAQLAVSFKDYLDSDNTTTVITDRDDLNSGAVREGNPARSGMELRPVVNEVYVHWPYTVSNTTNTTGNEWQVDMTRIDDGGDEHAGYVVEIKNPHNEQISLDGVWMMFYPLENNWKPADRPSGDDSIWEGTNNTTNPGANNNYAIDLGALQSTLGAGESMLIYRESAAGENILNMLDIPAGLQARAHRWTNPIATQYGAFDWSHTSSTSNQQRMAGLVALHTLNQDGEIMRWCYDRQKVPAHKRPSSYNGITIEYNDPGTAGPDDPAGEIFYRVRTMIGNGNGLNAMVMKWVDYTSYSSGTDNAELVNNSATDRVRSFRTEDWSTNGYPIHPEHSVLGGSQFALKDQTAFGKVDKTAAGGPPDVETDLDGDGTMEKLADERWRIANYTDGKARSVTELMQVPMWSVRASAVRQPDWDGHFGSQTPLWWLFRSQTYDSTANTPDRFMEYFMIDYQQPLLMEFNHSEYFMYDYHKTPVHAWLLARFDMLSPVDDGIDNDGDGEFGDGVDNDNDGRIDEEIPGNGIDDDQDGTIDESDTYDTDELFVPGRLNLNTVPYEVLVRVLPIPDDSRRQLVAQRIIQFRENTSDYRTTTLGLSSDYRTRPGIVQVGELLIALDDIYGGDGVDDHQDNGITIDEDGPDGYTDDREEKLRVLSWLINNCTTRSDRFAAYVLIRGYATGQFDRSPVEEKRFYMILDRSTITSRFEPAKVRALVDISED